MPFNIASSGQNPWPRVGPENRALTLPQRSHELAVEFSTIVVRSLISVIFMGIHSAQLKLRLRQHLLLGLAAH